MSTEMPPTGREWSETAIHYSPPPQGSHVRRGCLLIEIGKALDKLAVPASFWACLQIADLDALKTLVEDVRAAPRLCEVFMHNFYAVPRMWRQIHDTDTAPDISPAKMITCCDLTSYPASPEARAKLRDNNACTITGCRGAQVFEIFPSALLNEKRGRRARFIPDIWKILSLLFDEDHVGQWRNAISDHQDSDITPENLICLEPNLHAWMNAGFCALKPLNLSKNRDELEVEFHWLPQQSHAPTDDVELAESPISSAGLTGTAGLFAFTFEGHKVQSGDIFTIKTSDPNNLLLPSFALLEMRWRLNQIVALSAATMDPDEDEESESLSSKEKEIREWMDRFSNHDHSPEPSQW